jgi:hypothetical protein
MTNEGADQPVRCQKNEESLIPVYRSGLTGSTGTGKEKALLVPSMIRTHTTYIPEQLKVADHKMIT